MHWYYILKLFGVYCFGSWVLGLRAYCFRLGLLLLLLLLLLLFYFLQNKGTAPMVISYSVKVKENVSKKTK